jgi:hypothetical protein
MTDPGVWEQTFDQPTHSIPGKSMPLTATTKRFEPQITYMVSKGSKLAAIAWQSIIAKMP